MSVYQRCSESVRHFMEGSESFTEIDVISRASETGWSEDDYAKALTQANQIASAYFRSGKLVRYGPIIFDGVIDYARFNARIVYGGAKNGPKTLATPNGEFSRIYAYEDQIGAAGRRKGTNRDDSRLWDFEIPQDGVEAKLNEVLQRIEKLERFQERFVRIGEE